MPFAKFKNGLITKNNSRRSLYTPMLLSAVICILVCVINLAIFPIKQRGGTWLQNSGWVFDGIQLLLLNFVLWNFNRLLLKNNLRQWINVGMIVWIVSAAFDLMDEIIVQPMLVGYYIEDISKLSGMFCVSVGVYLFVRYVNDEYTDVSIDSYRDELTHLPNLRYFKRALTELHSVNYYILLIDIDFFKNINDTYGHDMGDEVLKAFGQMLGNIHEDNIITARVGGEEFAVLFQVPFFEDAQLLAESLLSDAREIVVSDGIRFTVSIGAGMKRDNESSESLLKRTDIALYQAKKNGRNQIQWAE